MAGNVLENKIVSVGGIDKNVPIPKYTKRTKRTEQVFPLRKLEIGDSKILPYEYSTKNLNKVRVRVYDIMKRENIKNKRFTVNADPLGSNKLRLWRTM